MLPGVVVDLSGVAGGGAVLVLYSGQLARVVGVAVGAAAEATSWHRVQGLGEVSGALQHDLEVVRVKRTVMTIMMMMIMMTIKIVTAKEIMMMVTSLGSLSGSPGCLGTSLLSREKP